MLKLRLVSGITLIVVFGLVSFWESTVTAALFFAICCLVLTAALNEYFQLTGQLRYPGYRILTIATALVLLFGIGFSQLTNSVDTAKYANFQNSLTAVFIVLAVVLVFLEDKYDNGFMNLVVTLGGFLYLAWTLTFIVKLYFFQPAGSEQYGPYLFFFLIIVTKCGDIGGYFIGKLSVVIFGGNHKMIPSISPKKSWEGLAGGLVLSIAVACMLATAMGAKLSGGGNQIITMKTAVICACVFTILGLIGDLSVSVLKRATNNKDSGSTLPGFGGVLDLLDSLLFVSPVFYCALNLLNQKALSGN